MVFEQEFSAQCDVPPVMACKTAALSSTVSLSTKLQCSVLAISAGLQRSARVAPAFLNEWER